MKHPTHNKKQTSTAAQPNKHGSQESVRQIQASRHEVYRGSIPHPEHFQRFEEILPGSADRILKMTEEDLRHTHQIQRKLTKDDFIYSMTGLILAGLIAIGSVGGGIYLIATGHDWAGVSVVGGTLVSLIGTFIYGTNHKNGKEQA